MLREFKCGILLRRGFGEGIGEKGKRKTERGEERERKLQKGRREESGQSLSFNRTGNRLLCRQANVRCREDMTGCARVFLNTNIK